VARRIPIESDDERHSDEKASAPSSPGEGEGALESSPFETRTEATGAPEEDAEPMEQRYLRLAAEFENHKKRMERERAKVLAYANEVLLEKFLPVVDNLERALAAATSDAGYDGLVAGVELTLRELKEFLRREGVDPIEAIGGPFDPTIHEAVSTQPSSEVPEGVVIKQIEKGYRFKERILRPAKVIVSSGPPS